MTTQEILKQRERTQNYSKALYYVFGYNDAAGKSYSASTFADLFVAHIDAGNGSHISIHDCFRMWLDGQTEFKR